MSVFFFETNRVKTHGDEVNVYIYHHGICEVSKHTRRTRVSNIFGLLVFYSLFLGN